MSPASTDRSHAYARLGVKEEDVRRSIQITPQLRAIAAVIRRAGQSKVTKHIENAMEDAIIKSYVTHTPPYGPGSDVARSWPWYLESSDSPDARKVLEVYYSCLKVFRPLLPIEAYCLAASVSPLRILE